VAMIGAGNAASLPEWTTTFQMSKGQRELRVESLSRKDSLPCCRGLTRLGDVADG
jgi:hypothetical protein